MGKVLNGLASKNPYIPYRESKLTHILKDSLGGNSKTLLIIQVSPDPKDFTETVSTLQFGTRINKIERPCAKQNVMELNPNDLKITCKPGTSTNLSQKADAEPLLKRVSHIKYASSLSGITSIDQIPYNKDKYQSIQKITIKLDHNGGSLASISNKENSKSNLIIPVHKNKT